MGFQVEVNMADNPIKKTSFSGEEVEVLGLNCEPGKPDGPGQWRKKLRTRKEMLEYLKTGERYWFGDDGFGSERRKTKA